MMHWDASAEDFVGVREVGYVEGLPLVLYLPSATPIHQLKGDASAFMHDSAWSHHIGPVWRHQ